MKMKTITSSEWQVVLTGTVTVLSSTTCSWS